MTTLGNADCSPDVRIRDGRPGPAVHHTNGVRRRVRVVACRLCSPADGSDSRACPALRLPDAGHRPAGCQPDGGCAPELVEHSGGGCFSGAPVHLVASAVPLPRRAPLPTCHRGARVGRLVAGSSRRGSAPGIGQFRAAVGVRIRRGVCGGRLYPHRTGHPRNHPFPIGSRRGWLGLPGSGHSGGRSGDGGAISDVRDPATLERAGARFRGWVLHRVRDSAMAAAHVAARRGRTLLDRAVGTLS